ncbi:MAG: hypothetical protein RIR66_504, partial [Actinomycetota bacterium]
RSALPNSFISAAIFLQSLSSKRKVKIVQLDRAESKHIIDSLKLRLENPARDKIDVFILTLSYLARFARPKILRPFRIDTKEYNFFIQQQIDPIEISKSTVHIVRLHDILPITHPEFFDEVAVLAFSKSLQIMLKGREKIWVMDSQSSANEFKNLFGKDIQTRIIPCVVESSEAKNCECKKKLNQICMVNTIEPRKRVGLAIEAFKMAKNKGFIPMDWNFVIVGSEGWQESQLVSNLRKDAFGSDVIFIENATNSIVESVYCESKIVFSTTVAEGFGLPPLEGMQHGCLPVVSNIPQHRETIGEYGMYFNSATPKEIAQVLNEAVTKIQGSEMKLTEDLKLHVREKYSFKTISQNWLELINALK